VDMRSNKERGRKPTRAEPGSELVQRGRHAETPSEIPRKGWRDILKRTKKEINNDHITVIAAGTAFFFLLGLIPGLAALISIYGLIADPMQVREQFAAVSGVLPAAVTELLSQQMERIASNSGAAGLGAVIGILLALWGGSAAVKTLMMALNITYDEEEKRGFIKRTAMALLLTLGAVVTGIIAITLIVALPAILSFIGFRGNADLIANLIRWPLLAIIAVVSLTVVYRFAPSRTNPQWRWVTWGSVVAMVLWVGASALFAFYVSNFGKYNETYGSLGAVVILLMWLYISAFAVLLGAELNSEMEHQTARDTTERPEKPMGQRGAHVADDLGEAYP
jgi:membrane protein